MADYPEITISEEFTITINPCEVETFSFKSGPLDTDYAISAVEKRLELPVIS